TCSPLIPMSLRAPPGNKRDGNVTLSIPRTMAGGHDIVALRKDDSEFSADVSFSPLEDERILAIVHDFSLRKEALVAAREFTESIVATIHEPLVVLDADERVVSANQVFYQVFQLTEEETLGQAFFELNDKQWEIPVLRQLLAEDLPKMHRVEAFELQHDFPGIGSRTVLIRARLIEEKSGRPNLTLLTFLNITERKRLETERMRMIHELESANEELNNFAYVVSHDLKAPLRAIGSLADWIATDQQDKLDAEGQEHLRLLIQRVRRMNALIDGVLQYSRIGRLHETVIPIDLNELVHDVVDLLAPPSHIAVTVAPGLPSIQAEKTAIQQVLQNLIANAIRYLDKPRGRIKIGCVSDGENWRFSVADNGPGIEARHFDRIFQLFQTLNPRDRVESTGVGLSIVKKIVEQCGGQVGIESTSGQGSTFFFTLPKTIPQTSKGEA
ncbi:MAG: sensor histidine kinase, partial [Nitrospira sp.]